MQVVVGSTSIHKINAVRSALRVCGFDTEQYRIAGCSASSEIDEQPFGLPQTRSGAFHRACNARRLYPEADLWIGIESGIVDGGNQFYDTAIVIVQHKNGRQFSAITSGHAIPNEYVEEAQRRGFDKHTAGQVMAERTGCDSTDGTSFITDGYVSRSDAISQAVAIAIGAWKKTINPSST